jgi:hypothetical protein
MTDAQPDTGSVSDGSLDLDGATAAIAALDQSKPPEDTQNEDIPAEAEAEADPDTEAAPADGEGEDADLEYEATADAEDDESDEQEAAEPIQPPHSWGKDDAEMFQSLPRDVQERIVQRENERDSAVSKKLNEAAETRKAAEEAASQFAQVAQQFDQLATHAQQRFADKWANIDWQQLAQQNPSEYVRAKAEYEADAQTVQQTTQAQQAAEAKAHTEFLQRETARLAELAPDLADPEKGGERKAELGKFLSEQGVDAEALKWASAQELSLAYDAMRWRKAQAEASKPKSVTTKQAPKAVRPGAEAKTKPRAVKQREAAMKRLGQSGSVDDAVAALLAR